MPNLGALAQNLLGFDVTPGFNLTTSTKGVPFIAHEVNSKPSASKPTGNSGGSGGTTSTYNGGYETGGGYTPQELAAYSLYTNQANQASAQNDAAWGAQQRSINNNYNTRNNEIASRLKTATNTYKQNTTTNQQNKRTADNSTARAAQASRQSILRLLGAYKYTA